MDVLVCGSRCLSDKTKVFDILDSLAGRIDISQILYRPGERADEFACEWADGRNIPSRSTSTSWEPDRKSRAGLRSKQKRDSQKPDLVVAFPGDDDLVRQAKSLGLTVIEIDAASQSSSKVIVTQPPVAYRSPR